jgi:hypothetical protein
MIDFRNAVGHKLKYLYKFKIQEFGKRGSGNKSFYLIKLLEIINKRY